MSGLSMLPELSVERKRERMLDLLDDLHDYIESHGVPHGMMVLLLDESQGVDVWNHNLTYIEQAGVLARAAYNLQAVESTPIPRRDGS